MTFIVDCRRILWSIIGQWNRFFLLILHLAYTIVLFFRIKMDYIRISAFVHQLTANRRIESKPIQTKLISYIQKIGFFERLHPVTNQKDELGNYSIICIQNTSFHIFYITDRLSNEMTPIWKTKPCQILIRFNDTIY